MNICGTLSLQIFIAMVRFVFIVLTVWLGIYNISAKDMLYSDSLVILKGIVRDAGTKKRLANVNVYIPGRDVGTVTNGDGVFALKISKEDADGDCSVRNRGTHWL
ncbi:MAG: carboxypeptidase-like regulatory domain-containing protein [Prevotella sp.]